MKKIKNLIQMMKIALKNIWIYSLMIKMIEYLQWELMIS